MKKSTKYVVALFAIASLAAWAFVGPSTAVAKTKKLTFEQAWKVCKQRLDNENASGTMLQANERYIKGGACMKEHGYTL